MSDGEKISRDDLESKFRALQADIQGKAADKKQSFLAMAGAAGAAIVIVAYVLGRRSGRKRSGRVEFRRF
jgi:hypothetical protein